ncbi:uncharacterized protein LOC104897533 isoform X1 [Beta vulgaris subsp. vulgaris]|uniref:uncharacterized protein LOC104897533 isoform X1 n=1 Tax=Beta vulgaris subsp. vulgaris TaxID=3555 RepID=UPI0009018C8E|nr:uncharacterized protein LOC104897533 isoform X1 [Beta vulgaris subsp. vulgaris]
MALPLGKLTLLVGAGILGSILAKEGRMPSVSDVISGAIKVAMKPIKQSDSASSTSKPRNDALIAQVNSLRQELQLLASSRPVTIVTSNVTGGRRYGIVIVIVAVGYGYVWWKGWKIPSFMFATKRGLSDACNSVAKQLDDVFLSLRAARNEISSKLDDSSTKYDEVVARSSTTKDEVTGVRQEVSKFTVDLQTVNHTIRTLETRMGRIQGKQDETNEGVANLLLCTLDAENRFVDLVQDSPSNSSTPAIGHRQIAAPSRSLTMNGVTGSWARQTVSLPVALEPSSPSTSNGSNEVNGQQSRNAKSASGQNEFQGASGAVENISSPTVSNGTRITHITEKPPGSELPPKSAGLLSRTISATRYFKFM